VKEHDLTYWRGEIRNCQDLMRKRRQVWSRLQDAYDLKFKSKLGGLQEHEVVKMSRFYPLTRQILASIAFNYPRVFIRVDEDGQEEAGDLLERAGNQALRMMNAKREIQQALFDALFCTVGWLKYGVNPPGDESVPPYVANDALEEDFPYVLRVAPENILLDPLTPPHNLGMARYVIEQMWVPMEYVEADKRWDAKARKELKPYRPDMGKDSILQSTEPARDGDEEQEAFKKALEAGQMVLLYEIHDRLHRRRITLAEGLDQPLEDIEHPFGRVIPDILTGINGEPLLDIEGREIPTGDYIPQPGYIVQGGFPYWGIKFDHHGKSFYPQPPMQYVEDLQNVIVESMSRRVDVQKRFRRVGLVSNAELQADPDLKTKIGRASDGELVGVQDVNGSVRELTWGNVPQDQINVEMQAREYEEQTLHVSELERGGGGGDTATEASLRAAAGSVNREWLQSIVGTAYEITLRNVLQICGDARYTPENWVMNVAGEDQEAFSRALEQADFLFSYSIEVEAGSMQPLIEELDKAQAIELFNALKNDPDIDQLELKKMLLRSGRVKDIEKLLSDQVKQEAIRAAQLENQHIMLRGQDPGVLPGQDHQVHEQYHAQAAADPAFQQLAPLQQQAAGQLIQQHIAQHQQARQRLMGSAKPAVGRGRMSGQPRGIIGRVQSNAQKTADTVSAEAK
jgi:hypothetical protein